MYNKIDVDRLLPEENRCQKLSPKLDAVALVGKCDHAN